MNENGNNQTNNKFGISVVFTLFVIIAVGTFIVKSIKPNTNYPSSSEETSLAIQQTEHTDVTESETVTSETEETVVIYSQKNDEGEVKSCGVVYENGSISSIRLYRETFIKQEWVDESIYALYQGLSGSDIKQAILEGVSNELGFKDRLVCYQVVDIDDNHISIQEVTIKAVFSEYKTIQTSNGVVYETLDGTRYGSLFDVPHTFEITPIGDVQNYYSEIEIT